MKSRNLNPLKNINNKILFLGSKARIAVIILIILQFGFFPMFFSATDRDYVDFLYWSTLCSYALIVFSVIFLNPNSLELFRDQLTLWTIVISCILSVINVGESFIHKSILIILGMILAGHIIVTRKTIKPPRIRVTLIGLGWSILAVSIAALLYALLLPTNTRPFPSNLAALVIKELIYDLSLTSTPEEISFRGLIFIFLVMNGCEENRAFVVQAILFWGVHFGAIFTNPELFFILIPLSTLFLTLIVKKYKMLHLSILMHTFINTLTTILAAMITQYFF